MNQLDLHYRKATFGYEYSTTGPRGANGLVFYLNRGLRAEREGERRMLAGDIRSDDLAPNQDV